MIGWPEKSDASDGWLSVKDQLTILIVDDDPSVRGTLATSFRKKGYRVETACNGKEALDILERVSPRLVLLDADMPVLDGWGFVAEVRARGLRLPLVLLSDDSTASMLAKEIGAAGYLSKPHNGRHGNGSHATAA